MDVEEVEWLVLERMITVLVCCPQPTAVEVSDAAVGNDIKKNASGSGLLAAKLKGGLPVLGECAAPRTRLRFPFLFKSS